MRLPSIISIICLGANLSLGVAQTDGGCDSGSLQCCNSVTSTDPNGTLPPDDGPFGVNCSPILAIGLGGNSCSAQLVCCTGANDGSGAIISGCTPTNANLRAK